MSKNLRVHHYRVYEGADVPATGAPPDTELEPYSRRYGFIGHNVTDSNKPHVRGGATDIVVNSASGYGYWHGTALCSMSENFCYAEGRRRAALRLLKDIMVNAANIDPLDADTILRMVDGTRDMGY